MLLKEMSDEDLIFLIKRGSKAAETVFYQRYSVYSRHAARHYLSEFRDSGISEDEYFAVAFSKIPEVLARDEDLGKTFYVYWKAVVRNAIYDYVKENSYTLGAKPLGDISLDDYRYKDNLSILFTDIMSENETDDEIKDYLRPYLEGNNTLLSEDEKLVARLKIYEDCSRSDIIKLTGLGERRVDYLTRTALDKIKQLLKENYL